MNSLTAALAMRSKRPPAVLIAQFPRRSSESQPYTAGTSGHFSIDRDTISSISEPDAGPALGQAVQQQAVGLVTLEDFPAAVAGEILVVRLVQSFPQQRQRQPREQRIAALQITPDRERGRLDPVRQQIVHQLYAGTDARRDVFVLDEDEGRPFHRSVEVPQRVAAAEAPVPDSAVAV